MARARFLVVSSTGYEGFPLVLVEALASGTPCLVPKLGGMPDIIEAGRLGLVFAPGDADDFAQRAVELWERAPAMRAACRSEYEARYTPQRNLLMLRRIYDNVRAHRRAEDGVGPYIDRPPRVNTQPPIDIRPFLAPPPASSDAPGDSSNPAPPAAPAAARVQGPHVDSGRVQR
jgi:hypothetical protein